jgi:hypothetical protein
MGSTIAPKALLLLLDTYNRMVCKMHWRASRTCPVDSSSSGRWCSLQFMVQTQSQAIDKSSTQILTCVWAEAFMLKFSRGSESLVLGASECENDTPAATAARGPWRVSQKRTVCKV